MTNFTRDFAKKSYNNDNYSSKNYTSGEAFATCMLLLVWGGIAVRIIIEAGT